MRPNEELTFVNKADMQVSDLTAGGYLEPAQMKQFIKIAIAGTAAMQAVYVTTMTTPQQEISKMTTMGRVMWPGVESQALPQAQRSKPGFSKVTLTTLEGVAEAHIPRAALEDQIERGTFQGSVSSYMGEHVRADLEDLLINGNTASGSDAWLKLMNGMLAQATTYVVPCSQVSLSKAVLRNMLDTIPEQFADQPGLVFWTNRKARADYRSTIGDRQTGLGDGVITGSTSKELGYDDIPIYRIPRFPRALGVASNETNVLLHDPKNRIFAFQRQMTVDSEWRPSQRVYALIMSMRLAQAYQHEPMVVKATQVLGQ